MLKSLWIKFFLLLAVVSAVAVSSALLLRGLMISDFREYLEGEMEDRAYWVTASLESAYEKNSGWEKEQVIEDVVWALMLGLEIKLYDSNGSLVMDTDGAIDALSPLVKKRVMAMAETTAGDETGEFNPYALFLGGKEIGRLEVKFLRPRKEMVFIQRSNVLLLLSVLVLGGLAMVLSIVFSRGMSRPIKDLTDAVTAISDGELGRRVMMPGRDEIGRLSGAFNRMAQALEVQESLRKRMTSNIAHELRTPITAVRAELEGMMDGLIPMDKEHVQSLYAEIGRLRNIIEGLEELARAEASSLTLNKQLIELGPFLNNITERYRVIFQDKGVGMELQCESGLAVNADPDRLSQIVINLLGNALKATKEGGNVWIRAVKGESGVIIDVTDNGSGIKQEDLPFIFERFYKASKGGLGLGLTIVKELVEAHGGKVSARSEYGKGAVFRVNLPV